MRIVRYKSGAGGPAYGILEADNQIVSIEGDIFGAWSRSSSHIPLDQAKLLAPVRPPNLLAIGLNYRQHAVESSIEIPKTPALFIKASTAVIGPDDPIVLPSIAPNEVDYEVELAIVIGKLAHHISENAAPDYILGYTCANDVSARDVQLRLDMQWTRGKSFDTFAPLGPWIETELDADSCALRTRLNGTVVQDSNTSDLIFGTRYLVHFLSQCMTLLPGTVILTGTPPGVGFARTPPIFLKEGDVVEVEVEGIGALRNPVITEKTKFG